MWHSIKLQEVAIFSVPATDALVCTWPVRCPLKHRSLSTDREAKASLKPATETCECTVANSRGFRLCVSLTGSKVGRYRYRYRSRNGDTGKIQILTLGKYLAHSLADARAEIGTFTCPR